jgi:nitronate monooxygenase/enoyl-[acyl-carrier protein] reductase II
MVRTPLCDLLGIEAPIIQAAMGFPNTDARLVAAACNAGALGSLGTYQRSPENLRAELARIAELTDRPFAVNHLVPVLNQEMFATTLAARPAVISFALGNPGPYVPPAHAAGALVMHQVTTVEQAREAAAAGVDVIVAQGTEAGGFGGTVTMATLVPQVVDAVEPLPVVAAGGIFDGRGLVAALALGAQGVNLGTRFLASEEAPVAAGYKEAILAATSEDTTRFEALNDIAPGPGTLGYPAVVRAIRSAFTDEWEVRRDEIVQRAEALRAELVEARQRGEGHIRLPVAGQSAGAIDEVLPVAEIVRRMTAEADAVIARLATLS